jgi:uncharacterized protein Yka (UPF0111/DUF47 family)
MRLRRREPRFGEQYTAIAESLADGSQLLAELLGSDQADRVVLHERMREIDQSVTIATRGVLRSLAAAFVTPFDRVDVYRLGWALRLCSRQIDAVVDLVTLFDLGPLPDPITDQVELVVRAADLTVEAMPLLGRMKAMSQMWLELTRVRAQAGETHRRILAELTTSTPDPAALTRLLAVTRGLDDVVQAFEDVAYVLEQIVVKES